MKKKTKNKDQAALDMFSETAQREAQIIALRKKGLLLNEIVSLVKISYATVQKICYTADNDDKYLRSRLYRREIWGDLPCGLKSSQWPYCGHVECYLRYKCRVYQANEERSAA